MDKLKTSLEYQAKTLRDVEILRTQHECACVFTTYAYVLCIITFARSSYFKFVYYSLNHQ